MVTTDPIKVVLAAEELLLGNLRTMIKKMLNEISYN